MSIDAAALVHVLLALVAAPSLLGVVNRTKAVFAGRVGQPLFQPYYDLTKLLRKAAVYSRTTTWVFRAGPIVALAALVARGAPGAARRARPRRSRSPATWSSSPTCSRWRAS